LTFRAFPQARAEALAAQLEIGLDIPICFACLGIVSWPLQSGQPGEAIREARGLTPDIWAEGLAEPALDAVRRASEAQVPNAREALADLERRGGRSAVARAIVLRLASELSRRADVARSTSDV
jgi:hypothetical protein